VVAGAPETRRQILIYSVLLVLSTAAPVALGIGGVAYGIAAALLGAVFLDRAWKVYRHRLAAGADRAAGKLFGFSIVYLFTLFAMIVMERAFSLPLFPALLG
jgi:protoheme IX farnesyltransferase